MTTGVFSGVAIKALGVRDNVRVAQEAEALGYESAWAPEVQLADAVTVLAASAVSTERLKLGTGIVSLFTRSPYLSAMTFASLADLSDGRVIAGFGTSTPPIVTGWHGLPFGRPLASTREFVDLFRRFLAGERVKSGGQFPVRGASLNASRYPVPVYLGALNDGMLELSAQIADGIILNFPTERYAAHAVEVIERGLISAGRPRASLRIVANFRTGVLPSRGDFDTVTAPLRRELLTYLLAPVYQRVFTDDGFGAIVERVASLWAAGDRSGALAAVSDEFVDAHGVFGGLAGCRAKVQRFLALGIDEAVLFPIVADGPLREERELETVRAFANPPTPVPAAVPTSNENGSPGP